MCSEKCSITIEWPGDKDLSVLIFHCRHGYSAITRPFPACETSLKRLTVQTEYITSAQNSANLRL